MLKTILFDLDGTLTDSAEGICKGVAHALAHFGIQETDEHALKRFIGPPLVGAFQQFYGFSEAQAKEATEIYREYYIPKGVYENKPYEGVYDMLAALQNAGLTLGLATAKPEPLAKIVLASFSLTPYFAFLVGSLYDGSRTEKKDVIAEALRVSGANPAETAMVGDRYHDIEGARTHGLLSVGVLYGFGSREELAGAGALAETPADVARILLA